eukprot:gene57634-76927_t
MFLPVFIGYGTDMVWLAILIAMNLQMSFLTPPFGWALFFLKGVTPPGITTRDIYVGVLPFVLLQAFAVAVIFVFPSVATWLPKAIGLVVALAITGTVAGLLAGLLGVGGGIVIVPVLYHLFTLLGVDESVKMHVAVGTSLATIIPTSFISAKSHKAKGNLDEPLFKSLVLPLFIGVVIGSFASGYVSGDVLSIVFASIALLVAANMAFRSKAKPVAESLPR